MSNSEPPKLPALGEKRGLDLGWIAGSGVQPGKRREIEGVSAASIMDLQAQLYQAQEDVKLRQSGGEPAAGAQRKGLNVKGAAQVMNRQNAGVQERNKRDMQHVKNSSQKISEAYAALERKAALYEKLAKGIEDDDAEAYEVDFLAKGEWTQQGQDQATAQLDSTPTFNAPPRQQQRDEQDGYRPPRRRDDDSDDSDDDRDRVRQIHETQEEKEQAQRRQQHKEVVMQLAQQTKQQRERAAEVKRLKEQQSQSKVDQLKKEFLKKQLSKLSGQSGTSAKPPGGGTAKR